MHVFDDLLELILNSICTETGFSLEDLLEAMNFRKNGKRKSGKSMIAARLDDDDDDEREAVRRIVKPW